MEKNQKETLKMLTPSFSADPSLIVKRGNLPEELYAEIEASEKVKCLLAGQRGMGKTTELQRLVVLLKGTEILPIFVQFGAQQNITIPMLIESMAQKLMEYVKGKPAKEFNKAFISLKDWFMEEEKEINAEKGIEGATGIGGNIVILRAEGRVISKKQEKTAKKMIVRKSILDLIDHFNKLIDKARLAMSKRIVFIVDDVDKIQEISSIERTFIHSSHFINKIDSPCIFTVPITYATSNLIRIGSLPYSELYRVPAVELFNEKGKKSEPAFEFLKKVFELRMPYNPIPNEMLEIILEHSGGVLIDAMRMIRGICRRCILKPNLKVDKYIIEEEFQKLVDDYQFVLDNRIYWEKISNICKAKDKKIIMTDDMLADLLYKMIVIEYREEKLRFDLHPAVRRLYEKNAEIIDYFLKQ